jgi:hypothetical protein
MEDNPLESPIFNSNNPLWTHLATRQEHLVTLAISMSIGNWALVHDCTITISYHSFEDNPEFFSRFRVFTSVRRFVMNWPPDSLREIATRTINRTPAGTNTVDNHEATNIRPKHFCKSAPADKGTMVQTIASASMAEPPYDGNTPTCYHIWSIHPTLIQRQTTEGPKTPAQLPLASPLFPSSPDPRHSRIGSRTQDKRFPSSSRLWQDPIEYAVVLQSNHDRTRSESTRHYSPMPSQMHKEDASIILPPHKPHPAMSSDLQHPRSPDA